MASYMNHCSTTVNPPTNLPGACQLWELDGQQFFSSVSCATKGPTLLWIFLLPDSPLPLVPLDLEIYILGYDTTVMGLTAPPPLLFCEMCILVSVKPLFSRCLTSFRAQLLKSRPSVKTTYSFFRKKNDSGCYPILDIDRDDPLLLRASVL